MTHQDQSQKTADSASRKFYAKMQTMPRLIHRANPDQPFDPGQSLVLKWLEANLTPTEMAEQLFWDLKQARVIIYDQADRTWRGRNKQEFEEGKAKRMADRAAARAARLAEKVATRKQSGRPRKFADADFIGMITDWVRERVKAGLAPRWPTKAEYQQFCTAPRAEGLAPIMSRSAFYRLILSGGLQEAKEIADPTQAKWLAEKQDAWRAAHPEPEPPKVVALPAAGEDDL